MAVLILKLNAIGDVVRTTPLLRVFDGPVTWITAERNLPILEGISPNLRCLAWDDRAQALGAKYELLINLEDDSHVAEFARRVQSVRVFGATLNTGGDIGYTQDSKGWFDLSLISRFGRARADDLKLHNRRTYQDLLFEGLGLEFQGQRYILPRPTVTELVGDVAIASKSGPMWPMKGWAFYDELQSALLAMGLKVSTLPERPSVLEHLGDISNHRCLVGGDSLPMHLALGLGIPCITVFNCTSPWEIFDYGLQTKVVSPLLSEFFYKRSFDQRATSAVPMEAVLEATLKVLESP